MSTYKTQLCRFVRDHTHLQIGVKTNKVNLIYIERQPNLTHPLCEKEVKGQRKKALTASVQVQD